jgi:hypothetical protein
LRHPRQRRNFPPRAPAQSIARPRRHADLSRCLLDATAIGEGGDEFDLALGRPAIGTRSPQHGYPFIVGRIVTMGIKLRPLGHRWQMRGFIWFVVIVVHEPDWNIRSDCRKAKFSTCQTQYPAGRPRGLAPASVSIRHDRMQHRFPVPPNREELRATMHRCAS